jgi:hypothetical protein
MPTKPLTPKPPKPANRSDRPKPFTTAQNPPKPAQARQQEMLRLQHLGDILGMNQFEVASVHQDLSEQAFKAQARFTGV